MDTRTCPTCGRPLSKKNRVGYCKIHHSHLQSGIRKPQFSGSKSGRWGGGEYISSDGYTMIKGADGDYCESGRQRYHRRSVLLMQKHLGRKLRTKQGGGGEMVHHIDGDKQHDDIDNFELCADSQDHRNLHASLEATAFELVRQGVIKFDRKRRKYYV